MNKQPKVLNILFIFVILCVLALSSIVIHRLDCNQKNLLVAYQGAEMPEIVCIGDSLTCGTGGYSYPHFLEGQMAEDGIYSKVINLGIGGENTVTIAGRVGAIPFQVDLFTIPSDTVPVEVSFLETDYKSIRPMIQGDSGINPCTIAGIEGRLYSEISSEGIATYYFQRAVAGDEQVVEAGTEVITQAKERYQDGIFVVFIGENGGFDSIDELIAQQQSILSMRVCNRDKYVILGLTSGTKEERAELEQRMLETYGEHYVNLREYMSTVGPEVAGVTITENDKQQMEQGLVPDCLRSDNVHYNKEGYELVARLVYERLQELGYYDGITEVTEQYSSLWKSICW